jgi:hypothetical protein
MEEEHEYIVVLVLYAEVLIEFLYYRRIQQYDTSTCDRNGGDEHPNMTLEIRNLYSKLKYGGTLRWCIYCADIIKQCLKVNPCMVSNPETAKLDGIYDIRNFISAPIVVHE